MSEHAAYRRIGAARAARRFPIILELVADGSVTLTTVALLRPHLTVENHAGVLSAARHRSKREVEQQIACVAPKPDVATLLRRLPAQSRVATASAGPAGVLVGAVSFEPVAASPADDGRSAPPPVLGRSPQTAAPRPKIAALAGDRFLLRVTLGAGTHAMLRRAQQLLGHSVLDGDPVLIIDKALSLLVADLERAKTANVPRPRARTSRASPSSSGSRHIPAALRREVWIKDAGRCGFVGLRGRCTETSRLEFHHIVPFARGGPTSIDNLALRCRAHNRYESEQAFGACRTAAVDVSFEPGSP